MLPPGLTTPRQVTHYHDQVYSDLISSGQILPFVYPWSSLGAFIVIVYLLIDHRRCAFLQCLRYPVFAFLVGFQAWCVVFTRAKHPAAAMGVGLLSAFGVVWVAALMVFNDPQTEFRRIERGVEVGNDDGRRANGHLRNGQASRKGKSLDGSKRLYWATYPASMGPRMMWVADLLCSFRGVGWNWQTSGIPVAPKRIEAQLRESGDSVDLAATDETDEITVSKTGIRRFDSRTALLKDSAIRLAAAYMVVDAVKTIMSHDGYFWGYMDAPPPTYLPEIVRDSAMAVQVYRLVVCLIGIYTVLHTALKLGPLFFCGVLGPRWIGVRGEAWMNPADMFGSIQYICDRGLAGWWAGWWHQVFRFGFEAPAKALLRKFNINRRSPAGNLITLFSAFFLSGCLHACGSYTQLGDTQPLRGPMCFFLLQALGIVIQTGTTNHPVIARALQRVPKKVRQVGNLALVHIWLFYTSPLLIDDFAKGGAWLFEPVAISPLRGLGLGAKDDTWWCWWNGLLFWREGSSLWDTGIAV